MYGYADTQIEETQAFHNAELLEEYNNTYGEDTDSAEEAEYAQYNDADDEAEREDAGYMPF